ncbi:hypothetical protein, partial [Lysinibacillus xylanilyticus]|uniref:hypothetical protein n=1 Tax=Lysinibacillus xylanilyticus TaxID=582475 RepID=UPI0036DA363D
SYNIDKGNFKEVTGVDYNFMNLNKMLLGCKSDKIKAFPQGREIYNSYIKNLESTWRRRYGYNKAEQTTKDFPDEYLIPYTEFEYFSQWYENSMFYDPRDLSELHNRRVLIEGPVFDLPRTYAIDWLAYNNLMCAFNMDSLAGVKCLKSGKYDEGLVSTVINILRQARSANVSMFEGNVKEFEELAEVGDVENILGLLQLGGGL